jgi:hypothetical protein
MRSVIALLFDGKVGKLEKKRQKPKIPMLYREAKLVSQRKEYGSYCFGENWYQKWTPSIDFVERTLGVDIFT